MIGKLARGMAIVLAFWSTALCFGAFPAGWFLAGYLLLFGLIPLAVLVHEVGHAAASVLVRWNVIVISVGWIALQVQRRRLLVSSRVSLQDAGGWVFSVPPRKELNTANREAAIILGGPIASLLQAVGCFAVAGSLGPFELEGAFRVDLGIAAFAALGSSFFLLTAVPMEMGESKRANDGEMLRRLLNRRSEDGLIQHYAVLTTMLSCGVRLRDLHSWLLEELNAKSDEIPWAKMVHDQLEIGRLLDAERADPALIRAKITDYWQVHEPSDWLRACDGYLAAVYEHDLDRVREMVSELNQPSTLPQMEKAVKAALASLEGNRPNAAILLDQMDQVVSAGSPYRDDTYRDIRKQIENIVLCNPPPSPN